MAHWFETDKSAVDMTTFNFLEVSGDVLITNAVQA